MLKSDRIIIVDLEATCWENKEIQGDSQTDIIEVGICNFRHRWCFSPTIKPYQ